MFTQSFADAQSATGANDANGSTPSPAETKTSQALLVCLSCYHLAPRSDIVFGPLSCVAVANVTLTAMVLPSVHTPLAASIDVPCADTPCVASLEERNWRALADFRTPQSFTPADVSATGVNWQVRTSPLPTTTP